MTSDQLKFLIAKRIARDALDLLDNLATGAVQPAVAELHAAKLRDLLNRIESGQHHYRAFEDKEEVTGS